MVSRLLRRILGWLREPGNRLPFAFRPTAKKLHGGNASAFADTACNADGILRLFAPRNIPHRLQNLGEVTGRTLPVTTPGGFYRLTLEQKGQLAAEFGITVLAPPDF